MWIGPVFAARIPPAGEGLATFAAGAADEFGVLRPSTRLGVAERRPADLVLRIHIHRKVKKPMDPLRVASPAPHKAARVKYVRSGSGWPVGPGCTRRSGRWRQSVKKRRRSRIGACGPHAGAGSRPPAYGTQPVLVREVSARDRRVRTSAGSSEPRESRTPDCSGFEKRPRLSGRPLRGPVVEINQMILEPRAMSKRYPDTLSENRRCSAPSTPGRISA